MLKSCSNNVTPANEFSRKIGVKKFKKICSNYLTPAGIVRGNDKFLYGEKLAAYLQNKAKRSSSLEFLLGQGEQHLSFPNPATGYGALCMSESIPM